jgi:hypothetical protein
MGAIALLSASRSAAQTPLETVVLNATAGSSLTIRGSTTIGAGWHCVANEIASTVTLGIDRGGETDAPRPSVRAVTIQLPVSALRCQSGAMERAMRQALRADRDSASSVITGGFAAHSPSFVHPTDERSAHLDGTLRVAGVNAKLILVASISPQADGSLRVRSSVPLTLSVFAITPPRMLFGAVRARDAITIDVDLRYPPVTDAVRVDSVRRPR